MPCHTRCKLHGWQPSAEENLDCVLSLLCSICCHQQLHTIAGSLLSCMPCHPRLCAFPGLLPRMKRSGRLHPQPRTMRSSSHLPLPRLLLYASAHLSMPSRIRGLELKRLTTACDKITEMTTTAMTTTKNELDDELQRRRRRGRRSKH